MSKTVEEAWREHWEKQVDPFYSAADRAMVRAKEYKDGLATFTAGAAYGRAEEREAVLQEIADTHRSRAWSEWNDALDEAEARIRQRGEKG